MLIFFGYDLRSLCLRFDACICRKTFRDLVSVSGLGRRLGLAVLVMASIDLGALVRLKYIDRSAAVNDLFPLHYFF